ncbi:aminotransferase class I/II-fold pyridoxal phosphate-dependent enzyme [Myxococcus landrumensis]|uniref:Aminotransferase class I/II-fold pyridoxal phosphate-dependent enzyme n=1 Tax=Myxococcus landrumensis TaxID=2813577 RepID=A0ABX7NJ30_9BACT|nr:aminotransferase class I/II-fold pyridoxal phosphate-dependent enzyme [Myxococcus landrumus]QSQ17542.1 aminotransferase class I/II-fold pyridoxal phosphate-dependent enzyme [Myxococcus landrumus]
MNHETFLAARDEWRSKRPDLVDLAELNVYRSLGPSFEAIAPSTHHEAPYRCHLAERFLAHLGLEAGLKARTQVSHGVRRSLRVLFGWLASRKARVGIPDDVYPVYLQLAREAGVDVVRFQAREGLPKLDTCDALLLCEPLKPWGRTPSGEEQARVEAWVREAPGQRVLLVDSAYATPPTPWTLRLMHEELAFVLVSLSKGWLLPDHVGLCITPSRWKEDARAAFAPLSKDEQKLRIGYAALTEHAARPRQVSEILAERARLRNAFITDRPGLRAAPCVGYFAVSQCSFEELLEQGVLGVPASVFGGPERMSILSSLLPAGRVPAAHR